MYREVVSSGKGSRGTSVGGNFRTYIGRCDDGYDIYGRQCCIICPGDLNHHACDKLKY